VNPDTDLYERLMWCRPRCRSATSGKGRLMDLKTVRPVRQQHPRDARKSTADYEKRKFCSVVCSRESFRPKVTCSPAEPTGRTNVTSATTKTLRCLH